MATKRLYRSRHADILGVCHGIAEWKDFPVHGVQLAAIIIAVCTAVLPCLAIYLVLGIILPVNPYQQKGYSDYEDERHRHRRDAYRYTPEPDDFVNGSGESYASEEDLNGRYEDLKHKVEDMEEKIFNKEDDWDARFNNS